MGWDNIVMKNASLKIDSETREKALELGPLEYLFPGSTSKILDFLCVFKEYDYSITDIGKNSGLSFKTAFDEIKRLEKQQVVVNSRMSGKSRMYKLNLDSPQAKSIEKLAFDIAKKRIMQ